MKHPWKKNFRKIPDRIKAKLATMNGPVRVGCAKKLTEAALLEGRYAHLGIGIESGELIFPSVIIPKPANGLFSRRNVQGQVVTHDDRPKIHKDYSREMPNFGDWTKGSHTMTWEREVYQRTFIPPYELEILIGLVGKEETAAGRSWVVSFIVNDAIALDAEDADGDLFFGLNLLQENVGACDVLSANAKSEDFLRTVHVTWELLPPGEKEEVINKVMRKYGTQDAELRQKVEARYRLFMKLKPRNIINGTSGFSRYFGAEITDNLVVFENLEYGNAIYVMYENWEELSKLSRRELLKMAERPFERIVHGKNWEDRLIHVVTEAREKQRHAIQKVKNDITGQNSAASAKKEGRPAVRSIPAIPPVI